MRFDFRFVEIAELVPNRNRPNKSPISRKSAGWFHRSAGKAWTSCRQC